MNKYRYNVSCSETLSTKWTQTAVDCYLIGCICNKCFLYKMYFAPYGSKCRMKDTVIELVRKNGVPENLNYE